MLVHWRERWISIRDGFKGRAGLVWTLSDGAETGEMRREARTTGCLELGSRVDEGGQSG